MTELVLQERPRAAIVDKAEQSLSSPDPQKKPFDFWKQYVTPERNNATQKEIERKLARLRAIRGINRDKMDSLKCNGTYLPMHIRIAVIFSTELIHSHASYISIIHYIHIYIKNT